MELFEKASRMCLRFPSSRGMLSVEDLWELPLTGALSLDIVAKDVLRKLRDVEQDVSLIPGAKSARKDNHREELEVSFDILKHVISVRVQERDEKDAAKDRKAKTDKIRDLIEQKKDEALSSKTVEELQAMLDSL